MPNYFIRLITTIIDFFYPPFRRFIPIQTFRYIACGGGNTALDIILYAISYYLLADREVIYLTNLPLVNTIAITPHILAFIIAFCVSFPTGFFLMRSVVFHDSNLRGRVQLFRYILLVAACVFLNYIFIKLFVERFGLEAVVAKILTTCIVVTFSYLAQRNFTFRKSAD